MTNPGDSPSERGGLFSGKVLILITLSLFIIVPLVTWGTWTLVHRDLTGQQREIHWRERDDWQGMPTAPVSFRRGLMSSARTGKTFEDFGFHLKADVKEAIRRCADLARRSKGRFTTYNVRRELEQIINDHPQLFYAHYLLGTWYRLNGQPEQSQRAYTRAFEQAGVALIVPYTTRDGRPAGNQPVGDLTIALDRVRNDVLIRNLQLVYPHLRTDRRGRVYLPLYADTPYRLSKSSEPAATQSRPEPGWFTFPGPIGRLDPRPLSAGADEPQKAAVPAERSP